MSGIVHLVGAGPGDPGLLTVRAVELIAQADVILHDRLIPAEALAHARPDAQLVYVGKEGGGAQVAQEDTHAFLLEHARAGRRVVRLKGGDPFVFGRGGEEALLLREAGIPFEVVPGITAGVAAPAYAGIPVTQREIASGVAFVTGHEDPAKPESALDWPALAAFPGTLVFYMGVRALPRIAERLTAGGRPPEEPVAVVERGTLPGQRVLVATLADVAQRAAQEGIRAPAITLVGPVAALREQMAWLEQRPLHGRTIAVTRARAQASALAARLRELGAAVVEAPAIRIEPLPAAKPDLSRYDLVAVTSPNGAERLLALLRDARELAGITVAAIGPGTARALRERGVEPDVVPDRAVAEGLVEALRDVPVTRALIARAAEGRDVLPDALRERGAEVDVLPLYETVAEPLDDAPRAAAAAVAGRGLPAVHLRLLRALLRPRGRRRRAQRPAAGLDRAGHERRPPRPRHRARPRGRPPHARRPGRGGPARRANLDVVRRERVAVGRLARRPAGAEPARPLRRGPVRERVGVHRAARAPLQPVVADRLGGRDRLLHVAGVELVEDRPRPHARVAVRLQLHPHGQRVGIVGVLLLQAPHLVVGPAQVLDVVTDLVRDHVRPGEVARGAEPALHVAVEAEVEIDALVAGAVERPDRGAGRAATRRDGVPVEVELRGTVSVEGPRPGALGGVEHVLAEVAQVALGVLVGRDRAAVRRLRAVVERGWDGESGAAREQLEGDEHEHADESQPGRDRHPPGAPAPAARVDRVARRASTLPSHAPDLPCEAQCRACLARSRSSPTTACVTSSSASCTR
jgi:uroporphyrinogen III methyltransferase / synthase